MANFNNHPNNPLNKAPSPNTVEAESCAAVDACKFDQGFVRPAYENFCFSRLPGFIETSLLGYSDRVSLPERVLNTVAGGTSRDTRTFDHVVFVFFDAFGWESLQRFQDSSNFLQRFNQDGIVLKTTSQFPSTTAAHITTAFSGQPAYEHQICGWDYFEPKVGRMIRPLKFAFSEDKVENGLWRAGFSPEKVLPRPVTIPHLDAHGVTVRLHGPQQYYPSTFNNHYGTPKQIVGYQSLDHGVRQVIEVLKARPSKSYQQLYIDSYDSTCHDFGVGANQSDQAALAALKSLTRLIEDPSLPPTLLIVSADHGQNKHMQDGAIPINAVLPGFEDLLKRDSRDQPIRFSGGLRQLFLHPKPDCHDHLLAELRLKLDGAAKVMSVTELHEAGLLGPGALQQSFIDRIGTIAVLPYSGYVAYWHEPPLFEFRNASHHGGASYQEMETPLLLLSLGS